MTNTLSRGTLRMLVAGALAVIMSVPAVGAPVLAADPQDVSISSVPGAAPGALVVTYHDDNVRESLGEELTDADATTERVAERVQSRTGAEVDGIGVAENVGALRVPVGTEDAVAEELLALPEVASVEPDYPVYADTTPVVAATVTLTDPYWGSQSGLKQAGVDDAWNTTTGDAETVIAVLDSGVDTTQSDLAGAVLGTGKDFTGDGPGDVRGHGTSVATVIAAQANSQGGVGVCRDCKILPMKVLGDDGIGSTSMLARGINEAVVQGADIINMSLSGSGTNVSAELTEAVDHAADAGILMFASAGNCGTGPNENTSCGAADDKRWPAALSGVISVAGNEHQGSDPKRASYSTYGQWVDVTASGTNVAWVDNRYEYFIGTSSSTPLAAGVAGLLLSAYPDATDDAITAALFDTAKPVDYVQHGLIDAATALSYLDVAASEPAPAPALGPAPEPEPEPTPAPAPEPTPAPEPEPTPEPTPAPIEFTAPVPERMAGATRYDTAAKLSAETFSPGVQRVFIATGTNYPDGLSASAAAAHFGGPVLLTDHDNVATSVLNELHRLDPEAITVVGGTNAISDSVLSTLGTVAATSRVAGGDRYDTAAKVATAAFDEADTVYIASGGTFADALPGSAAGAQVDAPVLLASPSRVPAATLDALDELGTRKVVLLGGTAALSNDVATQLDDAGLTVDRIAGANRYETAANISATAFPDGADVVYLASGQGFADALGGGAVAGVMGAPLLTVPAEGLPEPVAAEIVRLAPERVVILGGENAVGTATLGTLAEIGQ